MSYATDKFIKAMGRPRPIAKDGLRLPLGPAAQWRLYAKAIKPGWYRNRFFYLFGEGVQELARCLDHWAFLLPAGATFAVLGRNAYGSILILQDGENEVGGQIGVLDTTRAQYATRADWMFPVLFGQLLPDRVLDTFCDDSAYRAWRTATRLKLEGDVILGIKRPLPLGGTMEVSNFSAVDVFDYYRETAEVYRAAYERRRR